RCDTHWRTRHDDAAPQSPLHFVQVHPRPQLHPLPFGGAAIPGDGSGGGTDGRWICSWVWVWVWVWVWIWTWSWSCRLPRHWQFFGRFISKWRIYGRG